MGGRVWSGDRYVLDIRNNGGGLFPAGVEVARYFLPGGDIVLIADALGVRDTYEADGNPIEGSAPLVVLVNRGTASASEVGPVSSLQITLKASLVMHTSTTLPPFFGGGVGGGFVFFSPFLKLFPPFHFTFLFGSSEFPLRLCEVLNSSSV